MGFSWSQVKNLVIEPQISNIVDDEVEEESLTLINLQISLQVKVSTRLTGMEKEGEVE